MSALATPARLDNDTLLRALARQPTPYTPAWLMRQAGRYLPEYNATRARAGDFLTLAKTPALATEVTLQPLERFPLDAAILFSDILTIPDAMGLGLAFAAGEGPRFARPLRDEAAIARLAAPDPARELRYVLDAVREIRRALGGRVPLIGFAGSPYTLACYMVEGSGSSDWQTLKTMLYARPDLLHRILSVTAQAVTDYLNAQIEAGAQAVMVFDTWGGVLSPQAYREFSLAYMQQIVDGLQRQKDGATIPVILFTKGAGALLADMVQTGCDALGVDWTTDLAEARKYVQDRVALQGNLDPATLRESPEVIREGVAKTLASYGTGPGHVFNLGHGIHPDVNPEHAGAMVAAVHELSPAYHRGG